MTQPVQEPSLDRAVAGVEYRTRQLARRPAIVNPGGTGNLAMAYIFYDNETVPDGLSFFGLTNVVDAYTNPAAEEILPGAPSSEPHMRIDEANGQIDFTTGGVEAEPFRHGVYCLSASVTFIATAWAGTIGLMIDINPSGQLPTFHDPISYGDASLIDTVPLTDTLNVSFEVILQGNASSFVGMAVLQDSGGDLDIAGAGLLMKQIGWWSNSEGTFFPVGS